MKQTAWDKMIPTYKINFPELPTDEAEAPSGGEPKAETSGGEFKAQTAAERGSGARPATSRYGASRPPTASMREREAEVARQREARQRADKEREERAREEQEAREREVARARTEAAIKVAKEAILAEAKVAPTPVAAQRYKVLRSRSPTASSSVRSPSDRRDAPLDKRVAERQAASARAEELRGARERQLQRQREREGAEEEEAAQQTSTTPAPPAPTEADIKRKAAELLAQEMAAETPFATAKVARWRKAAERLAATHGELREEACLGGRRTGDRVRLEEEDRVRLVDRMP